MKIKVSSVLDLSQYLKEPSAQKVKGFYEYVAQLADEVVSALTSNLSYADNFSCEIKQLRVRDSVEEIVYASRNVPVKEIRIRRVYDDIYYVIDSFGWKYNASGQLVMTTSFSGSPSISTTILMDIIIYYG